MDNIYMYLASKKIKSPWSLSPKVCEYCCQYQTGPVLVLYWLPHETIYNQPPSETGFYMIFPAVHGCFTSWGLLRGPIMIRKVAIWIQMAPRTDRKGCLISNRNHCMCLIMFHKHITFLSLQSFPADLRPPSFQFYSEEHNNR